jgi:hypothetical protein
MLASMAKFKENVFNQAWWSLPVIPVLRRMTQDLHFEASLDYIMKSYLKQN